MQANIPNRKDLTPEQVEYILSLNPDDIDFDWIIKNIANNSEGVRYDHSANMTVPKDWRRLGFPVTHTTLGRYIFNLFCLVPNNLITYTGYTNERVTKKVVGRIQGVLGEKLIEGVIDNKKYAEFMDRILWLGFSLSPIMGASFDYDSVAPIPKAVSLRDRLTKDIDSVPSHKKVSETIRIEKEMLPIVETELAKTQAMQLYESGMGKGLGNNYKKSSLMFGVIQNLNDPSHVHVSKTSLIEGIQQSEMHEFSQKTIEASYSRAVGTRDGGYKSKIGMAAFQGAKLDVEGSDCKSTRYIEVDLTKDNIGKFYMRYVVTKKGLEPISSENSKDLIGTTVKVRSPMYCKSKKGYCNKCAGDMLYKLNVKNVGLTLFVLFGSLQNASMKKFHDTSVKIKEIKLEDYVNEVKL